MLLWLSIASAATLTVGPGETYTTVSSAILAATSGDVVEIQSGEYVDDEVVFPTGDITVRGVGSTRPILRTTRDIPNRKGIFVIPVDAEPVTIEFLHFEGARISNADGANGAGIRMQGSGITVRDCAFMDNQMGMLTGGTSGSEIYVYSSEFAFGGVDGSGQEHNIYVNTAALFVFEGNYTHHSRSGHTVKSRAERNVIRFNRIMDEATGNSSYLIDLPQGGEAVIVGNLIHQGPNVENRGTLISYNRETPTNPELTLYAAHNTLVNEAIGSNPAFFRVGDANSVVLINNLLVGPGTLYDAPTAATVTDEGNLQTDAPLLVDQAAYDYHLAAGSPAVNLGVALDAWPELIPDQQYVHPRATETRWDDGAWDVGAYGIGSAPVDTGDDTGGDTDDDVPDDETSEPSCGCRTAPQPSTSLFFIGLLGLVYRRR